MKLKDSLSIIPNLIYFRIEGSICLRCKKPINGERDVLLFATGGSNGGYHFECRYDVSKLKSNSLKLSQKTYKRLLEISEKDTIYFTPWTRQELKDRGWSDEQLNQEGIV